MNSFPQQAVVLAAGLGTRMRPLTDNCPKPLIEVAGRTLIDRTLDRLEEVNVTTIVVNSFYKAEMLEAHLQARGIAGLRMSRESRLLETGGGIAAALRYLEKEPFFAANADIIWVDRAGNTLKRLADAWHDGLDALLLLHPREAAIGYDGKGDFFLDASGTLTRRGPEELADYVFTGVQLLHPRLFTAIPEGPFSLNLLYERALHAEPQRIGALVHSGDWLHVGDPAGKALADAYFVNGKIK